MKHVSMTDSIGYARRVSPSGRVDEVHHRQSRLGEVARPRGKGMEMIIWAGLFVLIILATIALIVIVMMEEPARAHAALSNHSWIATSSLLFFS